MRKTMPKFLIRYILAVIGESKTRQARRLQDELVAESWAIRTGDLARAGIYLRRTHDAIEASRVCIANGDLVAANLYSKKAIAMAKVARGTYAGR